MARNTPAYISPNDQGLAKPRGSGQILRLGSTTIPSLCLSCTLRVSSWPLTVPTPTRNGERLRSPSAPTLTEASMLHWHRKDRGDKSHLGLVRHHPCATQHRQDNTTKQWQPVWRSTVQIWPDETYGRFHPPWDGIHDAGLDSEVTQTSMDRDTGAQDRGHQLH
jgi:hypothetical protein